ncbi:MAG: TonB-dependent receptor [Saprospiraceae bacterium]|nr:TonB-dependent receptor [Saprospiraceae bacterium]
MKIAARLNLYIPASSLKRVRFLKPYPYGAPILWLIFSLATSLSQAQTLRGTVRDADNGEAIIGATIGLRFSKAGAEPLSLATNPGGEFIFEKIRPGYYSVEITAQSFENQFIAEINVTAGKEQVLEIALRRSASQLAEVTISATRPGRRQPLPLGEIPLTKDQTLRFPATFFDPSRLAMAYPGVANTDDQANGLSIRGNSPASVRWRLEGVDIVNPNHLSNAGTFSDRPAAASGGILMFSAQLLDNSSLLTGAFPAGYGDAMGGIMDMNLRRGNNRQHEFTAQAGLIGLDLAAEGPIGKKGKNSYLVNYRYSTVGLLGQLGVSFGDEQINFQDLSFNLNFEGKKGGHWTLFGLGGLSENIFRHKTDSAEIKAYKDYFDIDFESKTGVLGVSNWKAFGKNSWLKTVVAHSVQTNKRNSRTAVFPKRGSTDDICEVKTSTSITYSQLLEQKYRLLGGIRGTFQIYQAFAVIDNLATEPLDHDYTLIQPWVQLNWQSRNQKNTTVLGVHSMLLDVLSAVHQRAFALEPRFSFSRKLAEKHRISFAAGMYSQIPPDWLLRYETELLRSQKIEAGYSWNFAPFWQFKTSVYRQWINNAPYFINERFSLLNDSEFNMQNDFSSYSTGLGFNTGIEWSVERSLTNGWFLLANASFFDSKFSKKSSRSKNEWLPTRWDIGHISNVTFGKEWQREKSPGKERSIGLNARVVWAGGVREAEIDRSASELANTTILDERIGYSRQYPDFFRIDLRVYWRKNLGNRRNSTFALDIQNLSGQQNFAYHYYDPYTRQIENKYQLGTIPNFSWRLEF